MRPQHGAAGIEKPAARCCKCHHKQRHAWLPRYAVLLARRWHHGMLLQRLRQRHHRVQRWLCGQARAASNWAHAAGMPLAKKRLFFVLPAHLVSIHTRSSRAVTRPPSCNTSWVRGGTRPNGATNWRLVFRLPLAQDQLIN